MLQQTTHGGDTHVGYFNMAVVAVHTVALLANDPTIKTGCEFATA